MKDINDIMPKVQNMRWGALMNKAPTNDKIEEMNKIFPDNGRWHTVFEEQDQVIVDGKEIRKKILISGLRLKSFSVLVFLIISSIFVIGFDNVYGHGVGSETFPPVNLNGKLVTLEVSSSKSDPNESDDQQISISSY